MKFSKNLIFSAALVLGLTINGSNSEAAILAVNASMGGLPILALLVTSAGGGLATSYLVKDARKGKGLGILIFTAGILLDKESQEITFTKLNEAQAEAVGMNCDEFSAYNSELVRINAAMAEMTSAIKNANSEERDSVIKTALADFKSDISSDAFNATVKISKANIQD